MPLDKSGSKESVSKNIKELMHSGKPKKQSVAIALDVQRRAGAGSKDDEKDRMRKRLKLHGKDKQE